MNLKKQFFLSAVLFLSSTLGFGAQTPTGTYGLDKDHSHIGFSVSHLGISNTIGRFNKFSGTINFNPAGESQVNFTIAADSIDTNSTRRDDHVRSDDFFDVDNFPEIIFTSTKITYTEEGDPKEITGNLEFHGEVQTVTFAVENVGSGTTAFNGVTLLRAGYKATTKIDRRDFAISGFQGVVGNEITITVNIEMVRPE